MKRTYIILILTTVMWQAGFAQSHFDSFVKNVLPQYDAYFSKAEQRGEYLCLYATEKYAALDAEGKVSLMVIVLPQNENGLTLISYGYRRELWQKDVVGVSKIDEWDMNNMAVIHSTQNRHLQKTDLHPWFFYFGGQVSGNADYSFVYLGSRVGAYLLKDKWDLALSLSVGNQFSFGPTSRVYFPVKEYKISPYVGAGFSYVSSENYDTWNGSLLLGISWLVGAGSLDFGIQISEYTTATIGYTFSPKKK